MPGLPSCPASTDSRIFLHLVQEVAAQSDPECFLSKPERPVCLPGRMRLAASPTQPCPALPRRLPGSCAQGVPALGLLSTEALLLRRPLPPGDFIPFR